MYDSNLTYQSKLSDTKYYTERNEYGVFEVHAFVRNDDGTTTDSIIAKRTNEADVLNFIDALRMEENREYYRKSRDEKKKFDWFRRKGNKERFERLFHNCYTSAKTPKGCTRDDRRKLLEFLNDKKYGDWDEAVLRDIPIIKLYEAVMEDET